MREMSRPAGQNGKFGLQLVVNTHVYEQVRGDGVMERKSGFGNLTARLELGADGSMLHQVQKVGNFKKGITANAVVPASSSLSSSPS